MSNPSNRSPRRPDPFLDAVGSVRDLVLHVIKIASWRLTFACALAFMSRLMWPLLPEDVATRGLLALFALSLGACLGKLLDERVATRSSAHAGREAAARRVSAERHVEREAAAPPGHGRAITSPSVPGGRDRAELGS